MGWYSVAYILEKIRTHKVVSLISFIVLFIAFSMVIDKEQERPAKQKQETNENLVKQPEREHKTTKYSSNSNSDTTLCYELGVKYGRCGALSFKGKRCDPEDDIVMPESCRGKDETSRGIKDGSKSVW